LGVRRLHRSTILGAGLLAGAGALAVLSVADGVGRPRQPATVERAVAAQLPVTVPTIPPVVGTVTGPEPTQTATASPSSLPSFSASAAVSTLPLSPIADQLPEPVSALPTAKPATEPVLLGVPDIGLMVRVRDIGVEPDGQLEIPDETEVGWYRLGSSPGRAGATVLAGHVSWNDTVGPFFRLGELEPGAEIQLDLADGSSRRYSVVERAQYPKLMLPQERIWTRAGDETLVLITCGGDFNRAIRRYDDNVVVYAVPIASTT
jgi:hypothetical protein